jgi:histidinol-phosphate aminotransferase
MTYSRLPDVRTGLRLHLNENTGGCSPAVLAALAQLTPSDVAFYPDYEPITSACERWFGVAPGYVQLTNGLDEGLQVVAQRAALTFDGTGSGNRFESIVVEPTFEMYADCTEGAGGKLVRVDPGDDFQFPIEAVLRSVGERTRLIYLTDPNNPTGIGIPAQDIVRIAAAAPRALVLVDEAYADFSDHTSIGPALDRYRNLIVGRTFAKAHGLAALRIGALVAHPDALEPLRRILMPYSINVCAIRALTAALADRSFLEEYVNQSRESRDLIYSFCERQGLKYWRSQANFVLVRVGPSAAIVSALAAQGIFVRDRSNQPGCAGCIRITAGIADHTRMCLTALENALASSRR